MKDMLPPPAQMMHIVTAYWTSQAVGTAARLGVADELAKGPLKSDEVARAIGADPRATFRLMRMLASIGVFTMDAEERFGLTPLGDTLRSGVPGSVKDFAVAETAYGHWEPWGRMADVVKTGKSQTKDALGKELWDWYSQNPNEAAYFTAAMGNLSAGAAGEVTRVYDFSKHERVADIGGAHGILLGAILRAHPKLHGILLDLPHVTASATQALEAQGVAARAVVVGGDFFTSVPAGADVHVLKQIIHDWSDEECGRILQACHRALAPRGALLLVEMVIPADNRPDMAQAMDLNMMVMLTGRERTEAEYRELLTRNGFALERVIPTHSPFSVIQAARL
ncbi:MAG TPA: methyltransferase [Vicinamibacterales bacterium]|nr:methyltransferase [Vicinamibacterales bacterium]